MIASTGLHIIADFKNCQCKPKILMDVEFIQSFLSKTIGESKLTPLRVIFYSFGENEGYTGMILLGESHVTLHTWPNLNTKVRNAVQLDIFVCNYKTDNTDKAKYVYEKLKGLFIPEMEVSNVKFLERY